MLRINGKLATAAMLLLLAAAAASAQSTGPGDALDKMTLEQKVLQMCTIGFKGPALDEEMKALIHDGIGGFFMQIGDNFVFPEECARLVAGIQTEAMAGRPGVPLFICLDQEGGVAAPLHYMLGATATPGNMALGASGREEDAYAAYHAMGVDMRTCGANVNYAPAIDVLKNSKNPDYTVRSFSGSMELNATMARGSVRGLQEAGVVACAKHFPGLAYYDEDTHSASPHIALSEEELWEGDLAHWRAAIEAGADMIMTCHIYVEGWDAEYPVTLSEKVLQGVLRERLGYEGIILTDSMGMGGINKDFGKNEATVLAVKAGCDRILQVSRNVEELRGRAQAVVEAVRAGEIPADLIDTAVRRTLLAKEKYGLFEDPQPADPEDVPKRIRRADLAEANERAALNAIVIVRDEAGLLPLPKTGKKIGVICPPHSVIRAGKGDEGMPVGYTLGHYIRAAAPDTAEVNIDTVPTTKQKKYALEKVKDADILVVGQLLAHQSPKQVAFIKEVLALEKPVIIIGMGDPADLALFPEAQTYIAANSPAPICLEAAAKVLFGEAKPGGRLPMPVGDLYPIGYPAPAAEGTSAP